MTSPAKRVMIVDDEEMVTTTLATYFQLETDYEIFTFQSPKHALESISRMQVDLVITDFLMPEMDGLQFIEKVQQINPDTACILLTGYADKENAIKAINDVSLYQYVEKPWDNEHLKMVARNAIQSRSLKAQLRQKIHQLDLTLLERDKLFQHNEMLKEELQLARNVQQNLLPAALPELGGIKIQTRYEPALEIGGDFYDIVELAEGRFAILLADVTGHGIQAALLTGLLKAAFLEIRGLDIDSGKILSRINRLLSNTLPGNMYVAAQVVVVEPATGICCVMNAGVPHPLLLHADGNVERIAVNGLLLGVNSEELYEQGEDASVQLQIGDKLLFFTDGLSEICNVNNDHFENVMIPELSALAGLPDDEIINRLLQSAYAFSAEHHIWDDVTILTVSRS